MLSPTIRSAVLHLKSQGHGTRAIAKAVGVSRNAVRAVLRSGQSEVIAYQRDSVLAPHLELVRHLHADCRGNLIRVHEELSARDIVVPYPTLTGFCRRHAIGIKPKERFGQYHFEPGEEMQHDTSPHIVLLGDTRTSLQCASLVLCYSRMTFAQVYRRFTRFECRAFLTEALRYFQGAASRMMIDNTSVLIHSGSGKSAIVSPTMAAFAKHYSFEIRAHEIGDANRSARVEGPFHWIENNFYAGRTFSDLPDINSQLQAWCDRQNAKYSDKLRASRRDLFAAERPALNPLPLHIPEIYDLHHRRVDTEGYVSLHRNRYSMPTQSIGRRVDVHELLHTVRVYDKHKVLVEHSKVEAGKGKRITLPEHTKRRHKGAVLPPSPQESTLRAVGTELDQLVDRLRKHHGGRAVRAMRVLHRIYLDYPTDVVRDAVREALDYGLCDLPRIERMVLSRIAGDFFRLPIDDNDEDDDT